MAYRTLEMTLISFKDVNLFSKMDTYAIVWIASDTRSVQVTPVDRDGGNNPSWNYTVRFTVPDKDPGGMVLHVLILSELSIVEHDIGEVHVPLRELFDGVNGQQSQARQFLAYQVRSPSSGEAKGLLNISYKFSDLVTDATLPVSQDKVMKDPTPYPPSGGHPLHYAPPPPQVGYTSYAPPGGYPPQYAPPPQGGYPSPPTAYPAAGPIGYTSYRPPGGYPPHCAPPPPQAGYTSYPLQYTPPPQGGYPFPPTAYPAAGPIGSTPYPPPGWSAPHYAPPPPQAGYTSYTPPGYAPPPQAGYVQPAPPPQGGYGGYGYSPQPPSKFGMGLGKIVGMILGGMVSEVGGTILGEMVLASFA